MRPMNSDQELNLHRLIDDELSEEDRARLLHELEASGEARDWRAIALGFLEIQGLKRAFAFEEVAPREEAPPAPLPQVRQDPPRSWARKLTPVASAACLGILSGFVIHFSNLEGPSRMSGPSVVENDPAADVSADGSDIEQGLPLENSLPFSGQTSLADAGSSRIAPDASGSGVPQTNSEPMPMLNVNLASMIEGVEDPVALPVYSPEQWQSDPQLRSMSSIPDELIRQLESQGYQVDRRRQWHRAPLGDGRQILVPSETVRVIKNMQ